MKNSTLRKIIQLSVLLIFISCGQKKTDTPKSSNDTIISADNLRTADSLADKPSIPTITIDTFSTMPTDEMDGGGCFFANDSIGYRSESFIYVNDFSETSYMKVNGAFVKFKQVSKKQIDNSSTVTKSKSDIYDLTIEMKKIGSGYESTEYIGTIKLTDKSGNTITRQFYGICGC